MKSIYKNLVKPIQEMHAETQVLMKEIKEN